MAFPKGNFDIVAQVEMTGLDAIVDERLQQLRPDQKSFTQQVGSGALRFGIDVEIVDLNIPQIRSLNFAERFKAGNTLASFEAEAVLTFTLFNNNLRDTFAVTLKDLQIAIFTTPGGLPVGVALGFQKIDIDLRGLGFFSILFNPILDLVSLGIRTALGPLGLVPIPIFQFADAFAQLGLVFDRSTTSNIADGSPFLGIAQNRTGLYLAADFQAANNISGDIGVVQDILDPNMNVGLVVSDRLVNQLVSTAFLTGRFGLVNNVPSGGINFRVLSVGVDFGNPSRRNARINTYAEIAARIRVRKGGFFGKLFGKKKKVTIRASLKLDVDASIVDDPQTQLAIIDFKYVIGIQGQVSINSILASVLTVLLGPLLTALLPLLSQLLNFAFKFFLPIKFQLRCFWCQSYHYH